MIDYSQRRIICWLFFVEKRGEQGQDLAKKNIWEIKIVSYRIMKTLLPV
jgi:hypothetical protein